MVGDVEGAAGSLLDDDDRHAAVGRGPKRGEQTIDDQWSEAERDLVGQHELRVSPECRGPA